MSAATDDSPLAGRRIGVPESRQLDLFADMLERRGAEVVRCPLIDIRDSPDRAAVRAWLDRLLAGEFDDMVWLTGEGVRRIVAFVEAEADLDREALIARLGAMRAITRGPKPVRELRQLGLGGDLPATAPTTDGVIDALDAIDLARRRIGVQLYGEDPNPKLMDFLHRRGAEAVPVAPYVYADEAEQPQVEAFIDAIVGGRLEAVAFTSSPQVKRLYKVARAGGRQAALTDALNDGCVAAVGPLVAERLEHEGVRVTLMPESSFFMKPLVRSLVAHFDRDAPAGAD